MNISAMTKVFSFLSTLSQAVLIQTFPNRVMQLNHMLTACMENEPSFQKTGCHRTNFSKHTAKAAQPSGLDPAMRSLNLDFFLPSQCSSTPTLKMTALVT